MRRRDTHEPLPKALNRVIDWVCYALGSAIYALAVDIFTVPNHLVPGGVTGISTLIHFVVPAFPVGIGIIVINLPLLIAARRHIGRDFTLRTAFATLLSSLIIDALAPILPVYTGNKMLVALFGGVLSGVGLSLVFLRGATTGGSEIMARLLEKRYPHIPIGRLILLVDGIIIALSALVYGEVESAMYATVLVVVSAVVMDEIISGAHRTRTVLVISERNEELAANLTARLQRGVTVMPASGAYTGAARQVLLCAVRPNEVYRLRQLILEYDPAAFIIVLNSDQVLGNGFQNIHPD